MVAKKLTHLIIWPGTRPVISTDGVNVCNICNLYLARNSELRNYEIFKNLQNTGNVKIVEINSNFEEKRLKITKKLSQKIWEYLSMQNDLSASEYASVVDWKTWFDCSSLVHFIYDLPKKATYLRDDWDDFEFNKEDLKIGDVVYVWERRPERKAIAPHYSIYLWEDRYLYKSWPNIEKPYLRISSLKEMFVMYPFDNVSILRPKKKRKTKMEEKQVSISQ